MNIVSRLAVSPPEFRFALRHALSKSPHHGSAHYKFALAISGGVDSMALAYMFRRYADEIKLDHSKFHAFIIDHKARAESTREASHVANLLGELLGNQPSILSLDWPDDTKPLALSNFESVARSLRYRMLGNVCRERGVTHLLLGHHADDDAELLLSRISDGHRARGLQGTSPCAQIPHCEGMYSVYESGGVGSAAFDHSVPRKIERGGLLITRPLLAFPKKRLIATCEEAKVPWVEDSTNQDPTFTKRNAIRSLLKSSKLPRALQSDSLLRLADKCQQVNAVEDREITNILSACVIRSFDLRSGLLRIRIPKSVHFSGGYDDDPALSWKVASEACRAILDIVSPKELIPIKNFNLVPPLFFPNDFKTIGRNSGRYSVGGVLLERLDTESMDNHEAGDLNIDYQAWQLSREPYRKGGKLPIAMFPSMSTSSAFLAPEYFKDAFWDPYEKLTQAKDQFQLWDGRYWIGIKHQLPYPLLVVPLDEQIITSYYDEEGRDTEFAKELKRLRSQCTSSNNRGIIPAIITPPGIQYLRAGTILALPSLGLAHPRWERSLQWDIRYKSVSTKSLSQFTADKHGRIGTRYSV